MIIWTFCWMMSIVVGATALLPLSAAAQTPPTQPPVPSTPAQPAAPSTSQPPAPQGQTQVLSIPPVPPVPSVGGGAPLALLDAVRRALFQYNLALAQIDQAIGSPVAL